MEMMRHWKDLGGNIWREIGSQNRHALRELQIEYKRRGCCTWLHEHLKEDKGILSVMEPSQQSFNGFLLMEENYG